MKPKSAAYVTWCSLCLCVFFLLPLPVDAQNRPPNIVFILMDNLGYGEVGCYGGGITRGAATLRIDKLATEGMRLLNYNVEAQCTPSRSAILTGRFSIRSGTHSIPIDPKGFDLITDPKEEYPATAMRNTWNAGPALKVVEEFEKSLAKYPPIKPGTPDPYTPSAVKTK